MADRRSPLDQFLDLVVYGPVGLALAARDEFPRLAEKGRRQVTSQLATARVVGQFAVTQGQKEAEKLLKRASDRVSELLLSDDDAGVETAPALPASDPPRPLPAATPMDALAAPDLTDPPRPEDLAIPGYDSLSASQVVQRLGGLSAEELEAVRAYETATRGRRTILSRIAQLPASGS